MTCRVLAVDDDLIIQKLISAGLTRLGYQVVTASSGAEGLRLLAAEKFDLLTLDLMMPEVSGLDVLEYLSKKPETDRLPVIVVSARGLAPEDMMRFKDLVRGELSKPFSIQTLQTTVQNVIGGDTHD
jgi:CheY-like chemotaxis protein